MKNLKAHMPTVISLAVCALLFVILLMYANTFKMPGTSTDSSSYNEYETAVVTSVIDDVSSKSELFEDNYVGSQTLLIKVTSGQYAGSTMSADNYLGALYGTHLAEGDSVVVSIYTSDNSVSSVTVYDFNRTFPVMVIVALFIIATVIIGGRQGAKSLIGLIITVISLIFILIPLLMKGFATIPTTFFTCVYVAAFSFLLLGGINKKTLCACAGTVAGLMFAAVFGIFAQSFIKVDGMRMGDYVDALLQLKQGGIPIRLSGLLIGGTIISALGAVMDVAMSLSSAMCELVNVNPDIESRELFRSGMTIGRDMIGTMTNTLILAFVGSSFLMVIYIYSLNVPFYELLSSNLVATELVHGIASSIGVILSVPFTVWIATVIYKK